MSFKKRYNLAVEEADILDNVNAKELTVQDAIQASEVETEITEQQAELAQDQAALEEAEAVVDELQEQVSDNEELLEQSPESVTDDVVAMSQESYYNCLGRLGYTNKDVYRVSMESYSTPAQKLRLSTEGIKEFIQDLIKKIKGIIAKCVDWIKKIWVKFGPANMLLKRKVNSLLDKVKKDDKKSYVIGKGVIAHYIPIFYLESNSAAYNKNKDFIKFARTILTVYIDAIDEVIGVIEKKKAASEKIEIDLLNNIIKNNFKSIKGSTTDYKDVLKEVKGIDSKDSHIYAIDGKSMHIFYTTEDGKLVFDDIDLERDKGEKYENEIKENNTTINKEDLVSSLKKMIDDISKYDKDVKSDIDKNIRDAEASVNKLSKAVEGEEDGKEVVDAVNNVIKLYNGYVSKIAPNVVMTCYKTFKQYVGFYNDIINHTTKVDPKDLTEEEKK